MFWAFIILIQPLNANGTTYCFWVSFTDKSQAGHKLEVPETFLSTKAILRRTVNNISFDSLDLPVKNAYIDSIINTGMNLQYAVKWFNGSVFYTTDSNLILKSKTLPFVKDTELIGRFISNEKSTSGKLDLNTDNRDAFESNFPQLSLENGFYLHNRGYTGNGLTIAIIDAGFNNVDSISSLDHVWRNKKVLAYRDFSTYPLNLFEEHPHGTYVFSTLAGIKNYNLRGSAPHANYILLRSEVVRYEQPIEMYNWLAALEYADSIGADIINTSLGYSFFDEPFEDLQYKEMNGEEIIISKASIIASRKGLLLVTSAGNEGLEQITSPADADSILAVGATDDMGIWATFSSIGPSFDNRVKPDVAAMGKGVITQSELNTITTAYGTSLSAPIISGLAACLWQAFPTLSNHQIRSAIIESSNQFNTPDIYLGYGIPNFQKAYEILSKETAPVDGDIDIIPTFIGNTLQIDPTNQHLQYCIIHIYSIEGKQVYQKQLTMPGRLDLDLSFLNRGIYLISLQMNNKRTSYKYIKTQ